MSIGQIQLVINRKQDKLIIENQFQLVPFKMVYRGPSDLMNIYIPSSITPVLFCPKTSDTEPTVTIKLQKYNDITRFSWIEKLGYSLVDRVEFTVG